MQNFPSVLKRKLQIVLFYAVPRDLDVRDSAAVAMEEVSTDQVVERAGGAAPQLDESQLQPMEVSLDQRAATGATKRTEETPLTPNTVEGCIGGMRSFDAHQGDVCK